MGGSGPPLPLAIQQAAVQRSAISPDCQRLTLRAERRIHSIIGAWHFSSWRHSVGRGMARPD
jgi:hypothetical protein